jgi:hypothetical protein
MIYDFQPGDGTRYNLVTVDDPHGGLLVICNNSSLWRYHQGDILKFLCGNENEYTRRAIWNHLEEESRIHIEDLERDLFEEDEDYQMKLDEFEQNPYDMG